jgi:hypothetical protein
VIQYRFDGEWASYIYCDRSYLNLPDEMLGTMAILAGLQELRPVPSFWVAAWHNKWQFFPEWLWLILVTSIGGGLISNKLRHGTWAHPRSYAAVAAGQAGAARHVAATPSVTVAPRGLGKQVAGRSPHTPFHLACHQNRGANRGCEAVMTGLWPSTHPACDPACQSCPCRWCLRRRSCLCHTTRAGPSHRTARQACLMCVGNLVLESCGSSVVEHTLGKGEVESSILSRSTILTR